MPDPNQRTPWEGGSPGGTGCDALVCSAACGFACVTGCLAFAGVTTALAAAVGMTAGTSTSIAQNN